MAIITLINRTTHLRDGQKLSVRTPLKDDGAAIIRYLHEVSSESDYLTFEKQDIPSVTDEELFLDRIAHTPNALALLAENDKGIVGLLIFQCGSMPKLSHSGEFGMSVKASHWGKNIGSLLIETLITWATQAKIGKINCQVREDNHRAIALYKKYGFQQEAILRDSFRTTNGFFDLLWLGLDISETPCGEDHETEAYLYNEIIPYDIRLARIDDAQGIHAHLSLIAQQTPFMSMGKEGPPLSISQLRNYLESVINQPNSTALVAESEGHIVGYLTFSSSLRFRINHVGECSLSILRRYGGIGIGKSLMQHLISWASEAHIHKINLEVRVENTRAISLYHSCGFVIEGRIKRTVYYNDTFYDSYAMGLLVPKKNSTIV